MQRTNSHYLLRVLGAAGIALFAGALCSDEAKSKGGGGGSTGDTYLNQNLPSTIRVDTPQTLSGSLSSEKPGISARALAKRSDDCFSSPSGGNSFGYFQLKMQICQMNMQADSIELNMLMFDVAFDQIKQRVPDGSGVRTAGQGEIEITVNEAIRNKMGDLMPDFSSGSGGAGPGDPGATGGGDFDPSSLLPKVGDKMPIPAFQYSEETDSEGYDRHLVFLPMTFSESGGFGCPEGAADCESGGFSLDADNKASLHWTSDRTRVLALNEVATSFSDSTAGFSFSNSGKFSFSFDANEKSMEFSMDFVDSFSDGISPATTTKSSGSNRLKACGENRCVQLTSNMTNDFGSQKMRFDMFGQTDDLGGFIQSSFSDGNFGFEFLERFNADGEMIAAGQRDLGVGGAWQQVIDPLTGDAYPLFETEGGDEYYSAVFEGGGEPGGFFDTGALEVTFTPAPGSAFDFTITNNASPPDFESGNVIGSGYFDGTTAFANLHDPSAMIGANATVWVTTWEENVDTGVYEPSYQTIADAYSASASITKL